MRGEATCGFEQGRDMGVILYLRVMLPAEGAVKGVRLDERKPVRTR